MRFWRIFESTPAYFKIYSNKICIFSSGVFLFLRLPFANEYIIIVNNYWI
ncbi:hypothetical protein BSCG_05136 [Bacteroides sp. 2_2_4]|nr:hypothetical protein BSCG_05136 [Bacteroides sp. 2_2_4]